MDGDGSVTFGLQVDKHIRAAHQSSGIRHFIVESNKIEGIVRTPTEEEVRAHRDFIRRKRIQVRHVVDIVKVVQPNAVLRSTTDIHGVRVGNHIAPSSGPEIADRLSSLLKRIASNSIHPWDAHVEYETLHPFTDGNGRSGRAIWLWHMTLIGQQGKALNLGFMHAFYYQTLERSSHGRN
jgi:hypothetical protein